jgi:hypothetical protein
MQAISRNLYLYIQNLQQASGGYEKLFASCTAGGKYLLPPAVQAIARKLYLYVNKP